MHNPNPGRDDRYLTVAKKARIRLKVKDSRFISSVSPAGDECRARAFIDSVAEEFSDASHNAWAYRIRSREQTICRMDDDREPAGTAGKPVLAELEARNLVNTVVVATRYFGGTKLGIGGLVRAYRQTARLGLKEAGTKVRLFALRVTVNTDYSGIGDIMRCLERLEGELLDIEYGESVHIHTRLTKNVVDEFCAAVKNATHGRADVRISGRNR